MVFKEKKFTIDELRTMLAKNFEGFEKARKWMLESPEFGNNNDTADDMLIKVV